MLTHPTVDKLHQLRCAGMAKALAEQLGSSEVEALSFEERLGLIVDRELTERASRQLTNRLRRARLRHPACIEDIDFRQPRALDKDLVLSLADGRWVRDHLNVLITGPAGVGKSWISCAPRPQRVPQWIQRSVSAPAAAVDRAGHLARRRSLRQATGLDRQNQRPRYRRLGGVEASAPRTARDLLEIIEDRHGLSSTIVTSQLPVENWHAVIGDPTLADAILDRLVHNAYQLNLKGESMRKTRGPFTQNEHLDS